MGYTTKPRSCLGCAKAKTGCDHKRPECSRCISKAIECKYPARKPKEGTLTTHTKAPSGNSAPAEPKQTTPPPSTIPPGTDGREKSQEDGQVNLSGGPPLPDVDLPLNFGEGLDWSLANAGRLEGDLAADLGGDYLGWDDAAGSFFNLLGLVADKPPSPSPRQTSVPFVNSLTTPTPQPLLRQQDIRAPSFRIPATPSITVRSLIHRPETRTGSQRVRNLILHTLKSYPFMMLRQDTLPPFIHPSTTTYPVVEEAHMEPLNNCISLVHMVSSGVHGSRKLFWNNVRTECERLSEQVR